VGGIAMGVSDKFLKKIPGIVADLADILNKPTIFGEQKKSFSTNRNSYEAWPHDTLFYDTDTDEFVLFFNSKSQHGGVLDCKVYMAKKKGYADFIEPTLVAEGDATAGRACQAAGILANGNYMAIVEGDGTNNNGALLIYESNDKGLTWTNRPLLIIDRSFCPC
jgi:hypothetical protein